MSVVINYIEVRNLGLDGASYSCLHEVSDTFTDPIAASAQAEEADIHTITGVLKLYFRELPEPLFTDSAYQSFVQTNRKFYMLTFIDHFCTRSGCSLR